MKKITLGLALGLGIIPVAQADTIFGSPITFEGKTFNGAIDSTVDFTHTDGTMYWELLDNVVSLDLGITARVFDGELTIQNASQTSSIKIDAGLPLLYGAVQADLPLTGFYAGAELNHFSLSGSSVQDAAVKIGWESDLGLGVEAGYRTLRFSLDDLDDAYGDLDSSGSP